MDLTPLAGVPTFGMNRIYLLFDRLTFRPSYYVAVNELVLDQFADQIRGLAIPRFVNWNRRELFPDAPDTYFVKLSLSFADQFSSDPRRPIDSGGTVTFVALQLAFFMGFSDVVLIGLDHSFSETGTPNATRIRPGSPDLSHFHPDYFPPGSRWQLPDLARSELAYKSARTAFEAAGRRIRDATPGGRCPVFERVAFEAIFPGTPHAGPDEGTAGRGRGA
jgi:hypothetical protein